MTDRLNPPPRSNGHLYNELTFEEEKIRKDFMLTKKYWKIRGYDSSKVIFEKIVPFNSLTQNKMKEVLRTLAAQAGLNFDEIVECHFKTNSIGFRQLLDVRFSSDENFTMSCGVNPHFTAVVI